MSVPAAGSEVPGLPGLQPIAATAAATATTGKNVNCDGVPSSSSVGCEQGNIADACVRVGADVADRLANISISNSTNSAQQSSNEHSNDGDGDHDDNDDDANDEVKARPEVLPLTLRLMQRVAVKLFVRRDATGRMGIEGMVWVE